MTKPRKLWRFHGGLHLPEHKQETCHQPSVKARIPTRLILPLQQHIGQPAEPVVKVGDQVLKGQVVAQPSGYVSVPIHASTSGVVTAIGEFPVPHPSGLPAPCIVIEPDGKDEWTELHPVADYRQLAPAEVRNLIRAGGIVGMGGAGFPTFIKLDPGPDKTVETLILNGAECEPYITADDRLMREQPHEVIGGLMILRHALQARECLIGVEDNKPEAYAALLEALRAHPDGDGIQVVQIPTLYPTGGEKQLIKVLTGKEVPSRGLPSDVGVVCQNVATAAAIYRCITAGEPLISRLVTVTGQGVAQPRNMEALIGTPVRELIEQCGGYAGEVEKLIMGGPMMGITLPNDTVPITKTTNCVLVPARGELPAPQPATPCIRCGECMRVCPTNLLPQQIYWHARAKDFDKAQDYNLFDCIECGCCAYVCQSHIPLVQYFRFAKTEIRAQEHERKKAELARKRHESRVERLEREKAERAERLRQKKEAAAATTASGAPDPKKAAIEAAMERVRAKRAAAQAAAGGETSNPAQQEPAAAETAQAKETG